MANSGNNMFKDNYRQDDNCCFDRFVNERQFFESVQKWIDNKYFLIVFGSNNTHQERHVLLFFSHQYFPIEELKGYFREGIYFAIRPDLFKGYNLRNKLKDFGFLEYSIQESIILMAHEYSLIKNIFELIQQETKMPTSEIRSSILVTYLNLLLQHLKRFYQQFMEDRVMDFRLLYQDFMIELQSLFDTEKQWLITLPSLRLLSERLDCTPRFLNDVSLKISGDTAQYHIDNFIVKIAKQLLAETDWSVAEIAKKMDFEQPQSLTRLFKRKTSFTPLDYRISII